MYHNTPAHRPGTHSGRKHMACITTKLRFIQTIYPTPFYSFQQNNMFCHPGYTPPLFYTYWDFLLCNLLLSAHFRLFLFSGFVACIYNESNFFFSKSFGPFQYSFSLIYQGIQTFFENHDDSSKKNAFTRERFHPHAGTGPARLAAPCNR